MHDMLVLCTSPDWKKASKKFQFGNVICARINSNSVKFSKYYHSLFPLFNNKVGCIYQIFPMDTPLSEFNCCDYMLDIQYVDPHANRKLFPAWVNIPKNACAIAKIGICLQYEKQFREALRCLIKCSRIGRIVFLIFGQGRWLEVQEITMGTFTLENFLTRIKCASICSGVMYFLAKAAEDFTEEDSEWTLMENVLLPPDSNFYSEV